MKYQPLYVDRDFTIAKIKWQNPVLLKDNWAEFSDSEKYNHEKIYFYKFVAIRKSKAGDKCELIYIGYSGRNIKKRLKDKDHAEKQLKIKDENQKYRLHVCAGELTDFVNPKNKVQEKDLETLLIYSHTNTQFQRIANKQNSNSHNIKTSILIENSGYLKDGMYKKVSYGLFCYE